jgi:hypothetical protein
MFMGCLALAWSHKGRAELKHHVELPAISDSALGPS